jgi:predicted nucleotidyltransferase
MKPSMALERHREGVHQVLAKFRMCNPRIFGSTARGEDTDMSDLDILIDAPPDASLYDLMRVEMELEALLGCRVEVLTEGFMAPDIRDRAEADLTLIP